MQSLRPEHPVPPAFSPVPLLAAVMAALAALAIGAWMQSPAVWTKLCLIQIYGGNLLLTLAVLGVMNPFHPWIRGDRLLELSLTPTVPSHLVTRRLIPWLLGLTIAWMAVVALLVPFRPDRITMMNAGAAGPYQIHASLIPSVIFAIPAHVAWVSGVALAVSLHSRSGRAWLAATIAFSWGIPWFVISSFSPQMDPLKVAIDQWRLEAGLLLPVKTGGGVALWALFLWRAVRRK